MRHLRLLADNRIPVTDSQTVVVSMGRVSTPLNPYAQIIDDAAIFPPGNSSLPDAVAAYNQRDEAQSSLVGPLLIRDTDIDDLVALTERPIMIALIATAGPLALMAAIDRVRSIDHLVLSGAEIASEVTDDSGVPQAITDLITRAEGLMISIELPRAPHGISEPWLLALQTFHALGARVKYRTGGIVASAHPSETELAEVLHATVDQHATAKLTAGLHRAVRHTQPETGFEQHGFLNVLVAIHRLLEGVTADDVVTILSERRAAVLVDVIRTWTEGDFAAVRSRFQSFGSCSVADPHHDLVELGLWHE